MAKSMTDQSNLFDLTIYEGSPSAISSPGSADGVSRSDSLDGLTIELSGPVPARVNRSRQQVGVKAKTTSVISGLSGIRSSRSADLQSSLANRLVEVLRWPGWTAWRMTWRVTVTPLRRRICALQASGLHTLDNGSFGLALPTLGANETKGSSHKRFRGSPHFRGAKMSEALRICAEDPIYLHPSFARIAMGYPVEWEVCAATAMPSSRKSRKSSSKPT